MGEQIISVFFTKKTLAWVVETGRLGSRFSEWVARESFEGRYTVHTSRTRPRGEGYEGGPTLRRGQVGDGVARRVSPLFIDCFT